MSNKNQNYLDKRNKKNIRRSKLPVSIALCKLRPKSFSKICRDNLELNFKGKLPSPSDICLKKIK